MALVEKARIPEDLRIGIGAFPLVKAGLNIDKMPVVLHTLFTRPVLILFLLFGNLGSVTSYFHSMGQGTMDLMSKLVACYF